MVWLQVGIRVFVVRLKFGCCFFFFPPCALFGYVQKMISLMTLYIGLEISHSLEIAR